MIMSKLIHFDFQMQPSSLRQHLENQKAIVRRSGTRLRAFGFSSNFYEGNLSFVGYLTVDVSPDHSRVGSGIHRSGAVA